MKSRILGISLAAFIVAALALGLVVQPGQAAATLTLSPSSTTSILSTPVYFTITAGNATTTYDIYLDGSTTGQTAVTASDGTGTFTYTFQTVGTHTLTLRMQTTHTIVGTSVVTVSDILSDTMPWFMIMIEFTVVFGVIGLVISILHFKRKR